jgi:hypothetical protein
MVLNRGDCYPAGENGMSLIGGQSIKLFEMVKSPLPSLFRKDGKTRNMPKGKLGKIMHGAPIFKL